MLPRNVLYYGEGAPLPQRKALRAGPLSLTYQAGDLRTIKLGDREALRHVYVAIRDRNRCTLYSRCFPTYVWMQRMTRSVSPMTRGT